MSTKPPRRSPLGLVVLAMLAEEPMHAYRMQRLIEERGKDRVVNVRQRASLYQTIERLQRLELIEVHQKVRGESHPDRVVYALTDQGRAAAAQWLRDMVTDADPGFPEFPVALSVLTMLRPAEILQLVEARARTVEENLGEIERQLAAFPDLPGVFLLEDEYRRTVLAAELGWLRDVIDRLTSGRITWAENPA
jgi:DNA-binding PadR family transcriptional regulator